MLNFLKMSDLDLQGKRVLIRVDLNVPMQNGKILNDARIRAIVPTLQMALRQNAKIIVMSHLGRPKEGTFSEEFSLAPLAAPLSQLLNCPVRFERSFACHPERSEGSHKTAAASEKELILLENVRFCVGEEANDPDLAKKFAALCDIFIMDAFAAAHRAHASTVGVAEFAKVAAAGPLLVKELEALSQILEAPKRPLLAIVGGAKVSSKLIVLKSLIEKVDVLILGGGLANTFLKAQGFDIGNSLCEETLVPACQELMRYAQHKDVTILLPKDVVVATDISNEAKTRTLSIAHGFSFSHINPSDKILDVGPETSAIFDEAIQEAATILWNGPVGVFEYDPFSAGTKALSESIARSKAYTVAGGGETLAAIDKFGIANAISYISTGGGAFLECIEGKTLPAVEVLEKRIF